MKTPGCGHQVPVNSKKVVLALVLAAATAHADCPVNVVVAPDDVRAAIDEWAQREQVCGPALEVRVVPTAGGLYLFARDPHGRTRERTVPDAASAAVLIASWMADDSIEMAPVAPPPPRSADVDPDTGAITDHAPPPPPPPPAVVAPRLPAERLAPTATIGAVGGISGDTTFGSVKGLRAELTLANAGRWSFGGVAALATGVDDYMDARWTYVRLLGSVGPTFWIGGWTFRPMLSLGYQLDTASHSAVSTEVSFAFTRRLDEAWSLVLEPSYNVAHALNRAFPPEEIDLMVGLRHGL